MRTEPEILGIVEETFLSLYISISADNNPSPNLGTGQLKEVEK